MFQVPTTEDEWKHIAKEFEEKWNVFNTIGAMDGKHIRITCPHNNGSHHFNYKSFNSIILFALADANYKFTYVDIGTNGRIGDSGVYAKSALRRCLTDREILKIPGDKQLPSSNISVPHVVLADDAFPLSYNVMKPYPLANITKEEKVFNYRLSRGRRIIESTFGILASRFRVFLTTINLSPDKVTTVTLAACTLHNLLTEKRKYLYTQRELYSIEDNGYQYLEMQTHEENQQMQAIEKQLNSRYGRHGREIREVFKTFYNGVGKVPWQDKHI